MQPLQNCIGPTIHIGREIRCLPYAGFLFFFINQYFHIPAYPQHLSINHMIKIEE